MASVRRRLSTSISGSARIPIQSLVGGGGQTIDTSKKDYFVTLDIAPSVKLPDDSSAKITSEGLLGVSYISVTPGGSEDALADGGEIMFTQGSVDLMSLIGQAVFSATDSGSGDK